MRVGDVLKRKGGEILSVRTNLSVREAAAKMADANVGSLLCLDAGGNPAGIFTERDLARLVARDGAEALELRVWDAMTKDLVCCRSSDRLEDMLDLMTERRFRHLPVVDDGRISGLVSIGDLVKARGEEARKEAGALLDYVRAA